MSEEPNVTVTAEAVDKASAEIAAMGNKIVGSLSQLEQNITKVSSKFQQMGSTATQAGQQMRTGMDTAKLSVKDLVSAVSIAAMTLLSLYRMIDAIGNAQYRLDKANLQLAKSQEKVNRLEQEYSEALKNAKVDIEAVAKAQHDLDGANRTAAKALVELTDAQAAYAELQRTGGIYAEEIAEAQFDVEKANLSVERAAWRLAEAQKELNELMANGGVNAKEVAATQRSLASANLRVERSELTLAKATENYNNLLNGMAVDLEKVEAAQLKLERANIRAQESLMDVSDAQTAWNRAKAAAGIRGEVKREELGEDLLRIYDELQLAQQKSNLATKEAEKASEDLVAAQTPQVATEEQLAEALLALKTAQLENTNAVADATAAQEAYTAALEGTPLSVIENATLTLREAQIAYQEAVNSATASQETLNQAQAGASQADYAAALALVEDKQWAYDEAVLATTEAQKQLNKAMTEIDPEGKVQSTLTALQFAQEELKLREEYAAEAAENLGESIVNAALIGTLSIVILIEKISTLIGLLGGKAGLTAGIATGAGGVTGGGAIAGVSATVGGAAGAAGIAAGAGFMAAVGIPAAMAYAKDPAATMNYMAIADPFEKYLDKRLEDIDKRRYEGISPTVKGFGGWRQKGGIYRQPTIIGVGEAGAEAVVPLTDGLNKHTVVYDIKIFVTGGAGVEARIAQAMERVIIKGSSSGAPAEHKTIELANTFTSATLQDQRSRALFWR